MAFEALKHSELQYEQLLALIKQTKKNFEDVQAQDNTLTILFSPHIAECESQESLAQESA